MFQRDYILRLVEEMTRVIAKIYGLKNQERKTAEALWEIDDLLTRRFRLNARLLRSLSAEDVVRLFQNGDRTDADMLQNTARLLEEEGRLHISSNHGKEGQAVLAKALHLYLAASLNGADPGLWGLSRRMDDLQEELRGVPLPMETERLLMSYSERAGRYAEAENRLYRLLESGGLEPRDGLLFYHRLLQVPPEELADGGLPLEEIYEGIGELELKLGVNGPHD